MATSILVSSVYRANDFSAHGTNFSVCTYHLLFRNFWLDSFRDVSTVRALKDVNRVRKKSNDAFNFVKLETVCAIKKKKNFTMMLGFSVRLKELINEDIYWLIDSLLK